jgi:hypothetical protein
MLQMDLQIKYNVDCFVARYNAHLMIMGFSQVENIDFNETFSLVERIKSIQIMLAIFRIISFKVLQMDVKTTFLNGDLSIYIYIYIYMHQLKGFVIKGEENMKLWLNF